ncbi:hypothetical protein EJD97_010831, partial [Solanum chilense]
RAPGGHRGRARGRGAGGMPIPPDIEMTRDVEGIERMSYESTIHITRYSSTVEESPTTIIEDVAPTVNEDPNVTQTTLSPLSSPDVTFIMLVDDMPQTPGRKKLVKRIVNNVNITNLPAKKRKMNNEDEDRYTRLRPRDVLRISRKGCGK